MTNMSMDAGGLAQTTYYNNSNAPNNYANNGNGLGAPGSGYASRGKGAHIKRLSVAPTSGMDSISENEVDANQAPRTSRSHLLAGLRTAPKTAGLAPASAPYNQTQHGNRLDASQYAPRNNFRYGQEVPQTATASSFGSRNYQQQQRQHSGSGKNHGYYGPEQVLAPPALNFAGQEDDQMEPHIYDELMATNMYLAQRQQQLQQQLINVTAAAQQFQGMSLNSANQTQSPISPVGSQMGFYNQQLHSGMQPVVQPVPNQPGLYSVYNPMTGQHSYIVDPAFQQHNLPSSPPGFKGSPEAENSAIYGRGRSSPPSSAAQRYNSVTPPKGNPSPPNDVTPLPPPSSTAYRPGHRKSISGNWGINRNTPENVKAPPMSAGFVKTPMTGTFGPGMARAGEHPTRQPRGPPPLEELIAKPTSKLEGSKNFTARQRRRAVFNLVRAGNERRRNGDGETPGSEKEFNFTVSSDADSEGSGSASSLGSLRNNGVIGSERKQRPSPPRQNTGSSLASEDSWRGGFEARESSPSTSSRRQPLLVLTSAAEKRKSTLY